MSDVAKAEQTLRDLERKRTALIETRAAHDVERREISFAAIAGGDKVAKKKLDELSEQAIRFEVELKNIEAAVAQAQNNLGAARQHAAHEQDKANARAVAEGLGELAAHGQVVDDALHDLVEAGANLRVIFNRLHSLGCGHPTHEQLSTFGHLAIVTALNKSIWSRGFEVLAPGQQKTFSDVIGVWRATLAKDVERRLGEPAEQKEHADAA